MEGQKGLPGFWSWQQVNLHLLRLQTGVQEDRSSVSELVQCVRRTS